MSGRILLGLVLLGSLGLSSGCFRHCLGHRYNAYHAARNNPGAYWTGAGLSTAGSAALRAASRQSHPGAALAAAALGVGLHAAAAGSYHRAATTPSHQRYSRRTYYHTPRYRRHYYSRHYHYGCR
ncbi:MAG: hypothetical protein ACYTFG_21110 [Planctomycetota bacterium]|jgi:hypothetical protein